MDIATIGAMLHVFWTVWLIVLFVGMIVYAVWAGYRSRFASPHRLQLPGENSPTV